MIRSELKSVCVGAGVGEAERGELAAAEDSNIVMSAIPCPLLHMCGMDGTQ